MMDSKRLECITNIGKADHFLSDNIQERNSSLETPFLFSLFYQLYELYIQNRNRKSEWLAILSTDCTLSEQEIVRIYGMRWDIEVFFKTTKSLLRLQKEFQGMSYDLLISHTAIVFSKYIVLSWQNRCHNNQRPLGVSFMHYVMKSMNWIGLSHCSN